MALTENTERNRVLIMYYNRIDKIQSKILREFLEKYDINKNEYKKNIVDIIVEVDKKKHIKAAEKEFRKYADVIAKFKYIPYFAIRTDGVTAKNILTLNKDNIERPMKYLYQSFKKLYFSGKMKASPISSQSENSGFWNLDTIKRDNALTISDGGGVKIGVIDTGIDYTHPEIEKRFKRKKGINFITGGEPYDDDGHGTHVSGIIAGKNTGIAVKSTLYGIKVLDGNGSGSETDVIKGIEWAIDNNLDVVNMSLGSSYCSRAMVDITEYAYEKGLIMVAAAGNEERGEEYPAALPTVISVAATDQYNQHPEFSNITNTLNVSAPGVDILSSFPGNNYIYLTGTSMATPHVTGSIALAEKLRKYTTLDELLNLIAKTSTEATNNTNEEYQSVFGSGIINAYKLIQTLNDFEDFKRKNGR